MNTIAFKILPALESNDHEVRILTDGNDLLGEDYLGLDPPAFFGQSNFFVTGELMIGRCTCGCEGCSDYPVTVSIDNNLITGQTRMGLILNSKKQTMKRV